MILNYRLMTLFYNKFSDTINFNFIAKHISADYNEDMSQQLGIDFKLFTKENI